MSKILPIRFRAGEPTAKISAEFLNRVGEVLDQLEVDGGQIIRNNNRWTIVIEPTPYQSIPQNGRVGDVLRWGESGPYWETPGEC